MFKACSTCKKPIALGATYWVCSVSTCQRERVGFFFCSEECWDAHVPIFRHRDAWAEERRAPNQAPVVVEAAAPRAPTPSPRAADAGAVSTDDILVVASKLKAYIKARSGMSTSEGVLTVLSHRLRRLSDHAIERARADGRKTVLDRDY
jgi:hypothetical protein